MKGEAEYQFSCKSSGKNTYFPYFKQITKIFYCKAAFSGILAAFHTRYK